MKELTLNEFIFHHILDAEHSIDTLGLLWEIDRTCCKIIVNNEVREKYRTKLGQLSEIRDKYFQIHVLPFLNLLLHKPEKTVERDYPNKLADPQLENHSDAPFIRAALASADRALVTTDGQLANLLREKSVDLKVMTPQQACEKLRQRGEKDSAQHLSRVT